MLPQAKHRTARESPPHPECPGQFGCAGLPFRIVRSASGKRCTEDRCRRPGPERRPAGLRTMAARLISGRSSS